MAACVESSMLRMKHAALLCQADAALAEKRWERAATLTARILRRDAKHVGALEVAAKAHWGKGDHQEVVRITERLIRLNPFEPGYHSLRGAALQGLGRFREAMQCYRRSQAMGCEADAVASLAFLEECQRALLEELLVSDETFRDAYRRDPEGACLSKGLTLTSLSLSGDLSFLSIRPS